MIIAREENTGFKHVGMLKSFGKESWFKAECEPGKYIAYVNSLVYRRLNHPGGGM